MTTEGGVQADLKRIILAAPMKSGSTFAGNAVRHYFRIFDQPPLPHVPFLTEQNITPWLLYDVRGHSFSFNFHMLPHASNLIAAHEEGISTVVLWRNLGDMLVSFDDHQFSSEAGNTAQFYVMNLERYQKAEPAARFTFLIDTIVPWYIGFYARWRDCNVILHPYEELVADLRQYFHNVIADLIGGPPDDAILDEISAIGPGKVSRFNVGRIGRSAEKFSDAVKRRLEDKILTHPDHEQLEILLWELPWEVPAVRSGAPLDGQVVRIADEPLPFFVSSGRAHPVLHASWLATRFGERRTPRLVERSELADYPRGEPLV